MGYLYSWGGGRGIIGTSASIGAEGEMYSPEQPVDGVEDLLGAEDLLSAEMDIGADSAISAIIPDVGLIGTVGTMLQGLVSRSVGLPS